MTALLSGLAKETRRIAAAAKPAFVAFSLPGVIIAIRFSIRFNDTARQG